MFVRNAMRDGGEQARQRRTPPDIFVLGGAATENGTRLAFGGASATFAEERWRYRGGIGRSDIHLQFYGIGGSLGGGERSIGYALDGWMSNQQLLRRLGDGDNWLGVRWIDLDLDSKADLAGIRTPGSAPARPLGRHRLRGRTRRRRRLHPGRQRVALIAARDAQARADGSHEKRCL